MGWGHRPGYSLGKNKVAGIEKWEKQLLVFVYIKYGKFWSVSLKQKVEHKTLISEQWLLYATGIASMYILLKYKL